MSEIYKNTSQYVYLDVYGGQADEQPTAEFVDALGNTRSLNVTSSTPLPSADDRYYVILTMADTANEGSISVEWNFAINGVSTTKSDYFDVVTPYLSISEVKKIWPEATDEQAKDVEAAVRHVINAHTGQSFGYGTKSITVEGHGETALRLPERCIEVTGFSTLNANLDPRSVIVVSDGWYLKKSWAAEVSTISSDSSYWGDYRDGVFDHSIYSDPDGDGEGPFIGPLSERPGGIIVAPGAGRATSWRQDYPFKITGVFGYKTVPAPVKEAAKLLVNDYACPEALYRDRYLESVKAADWRLQFSSSAWDHTGNVRADQLLSEFVLLDWAVI